MSRLERGTHIGLIAVCLVTLGLLLERRFVRVPSAPMPGAKTLIGTHLNVRGVSWTRVNAVLYLNTNCSFCIQSMPFYRKITNTLSNRKTATFVAVSNGSPEEVAALLKKEQVAVDGVYHIPQMAGLRGTPTLLIVDEAGTVRSAFEGTLNSSHQEEFLALVQGGKIVSGVGADGGETAASR